MLEEAGELEEAEVTRRAALDAARDIHGDDHPHTLIALSELARLVITQARTRALDPGPTRARLQARL